MRLKFQETSRPNLRSKSQQPLFFPHARQLSESNMFPVNRQHYRELYQLREQDPVPTIEIWSSLEEIQQEFDKEDETCFVRTAVQFFLGEITLEDYFDRLISHLEVDAERHTFDKAKSTKLENLLRVDLISAAVKSLMLNRSFRRLSETGALCYI